ncbi:uncharacterized protein LOC129608383 [Condylostylus longicornis]|uniref:uncharacterized protein LOC129608383 n=1 Tax=Condylostylus longicornis TaxID=2530218 RepID=UPI00244E0A62|nr:uncharacterized protein LOC129608383 [Condylostylus longicornis]
MAFKNNTLTKIPHCEWEQLRDLYKIDWLKHHIVYNSIQNYIKWFEKDSKIKNLEIFSLNDNWSQDGTFLILDRYLVLANTLNDNLNNLITILNLLDKSRYYYIFGITERILPAIEQFFKINNWKFNPEENRTVWHILDRKCIENFDIKPPKGIILKSLSEENSGIINELWPYSHPGSENFIKRQIKYNYSLGTFNENSGELIAWCLRQGYGSLMVKAMSKFYYNNEEDVTAPVVATNTASRNMFQKLGFKEFENKIKFFAMSSSLDQLVEIEQNDWPILRDLYKIEWPKHHIAFNIIQNYINWFQKDPNVKYIKVYSLNGDWSDGTFVIVDRYIVPFCTLNKNLNRLTTALNLLDKSIPYYLYGYVERVAPAAKKYYEINNWIYDKHVCNTIWYRKKNNNKLEFEIKIPDHLILKPLQENDAIIVNNVWPHRHPGSLNAIKRLIRYNESLGIFRKDNDELIAWCLRLTLGSPGSLQVKDEYKRQGLGILLAKAMSNILMNLGMEIVAPVVEENVASKKMFESLDLQKVDMIYCNWTEPLNPNNVWEDKDCE